MENLRYLLVAIAALTLIMSVVSGVNPNYFAGLNAFADHNDDEEDDDNSSSGSNDDHEDNEEDDDEHEEEDDDEHDEESEDESELVESLGNHSRVSLEIDDDHVDLEVEIEDGDLKDGTHDVMFACDSPDVSEEFLNALDVEDGEGDFETEMALANGTYSGCEVEIGELSVTFASFVIMPEEEDDEHEEDNEEEDDDDDEHESEAKTKSKLKTEDDGAEIEVEVEGLNMTDGSYDALFACEEPALNMTLENAFEVEDGEGKLEETIRLANDTYSGCDVTVEGTVLASFDDFTVSEETEEEQENEVEEKRKEKKERIVTTTNGKKIHEKHRSQNAASPGDYQPGWNYTLTANGTATQAGGSIPPQYKALVAGLDMSVWKSSGAIILFDVIGGTVEVENQTYTVVVGYALYTIHHDTFKVGALAVDDDGNVYKLKLRGSADDDAEFPTESGSLDLTFEGSSGPSNNRIGDWELTLEGTVEAG